MIAVLQTFGLMIIAGLICAGFDLWSAAVWLIAAGIFGAIGFLRGGWLKRYRH